MNFQSKSKIAANAEELMGSTPMVRLNRSLKGVPAGTWLSKKMPGVGIGDVKSELLAKVEFFNPGGSTKDRIAVAMVNAAEKSGKLKPGGTIVEATSGNTGAGLAIVAALRGYKCIFVMPDKMAAEKVNALRAYGASVVVTPHTVGPSSPDYYVNTAGRIARETPNSFHANQYFNPDNPGAHYASTGPEIWQQCEGKIDLFFAGIGTGGTMSGIARYLKEKDPKVRVVGIDPVGSIYAGIIENGQPSEAKAYLVEGIGEDMMPGSMTIELINDCVTVNDTESFAATRMLCQTEALLLGGSCGSAFYGAAQYLRYIEAKENRSFRAVVLFPDSGSRYLSKVYNPGWLKEKNVTGASNWGDKNLEAPVSYLPSAKPIPGVI